MITSFTNNWLKFITENVQFHQLIAAFFRRIYSFLSQSDVVEKMCVAKCKIYLFIHSVVSVEEKKTCYAVMNIDMTVILMRIINNSATFVCVCDCVCKTVEKNNVR